MVVIPSVPVRTVPEFVAYAKANPAKLNMASSGNATPSHLTGELFKMMTGVTMTHVPYRGAAPATTDLLAGQVQVFFTGVTNALDYIKAGKLRALAVTAAARSQILPDLPTVGEFLPGYVANNWHGIGAPQGTPLEVINTLNKGINAALLDSKLVTRFAELGATVLSGSPSDFKNLTVEETEKWGKVVKFANIKPD